MLTIPNMNYTHPLKSRRVGILTTQQEIILEHVKKNGFVTNEIAQTLLSVKQTRAYSVIRELVNAGLIAKKSSAREEKEYIMLK